jgi:hypothetical protein
MLLLVEVTDAAACFETTKNACGRDAMIHCSSRAFIFVFQRSSEQVCLITDNTAAAAVAVQNH